MIQFDPNLSYALKDFENDMNSFINLMSVDFGGPSPSLKIFDEETFKVTEYVFNTKHPQYQLSMHFIEKYDEDRCYTFLYRFNAVMAFIQKWEGLLIEKGLLMSEPYHVKEDLIKTLLKYPINVKSVIIPKKVLSSF